MLAKQNAHSKSSTENTLKAIRTNRQNCKFAQHILETGHEYDTLDQSMEILHTEKKGSKLNTLERFHIYDITKKGLQMNNTPRHT
jgi:hypothetical protein